MAQSLGQGSPLPGEELHNSELPENPANFDNQVGKNEIAETLGAGITLDSSDRIDDLDSEQPGADRGIESVEPLLTEPVPQPTFKLVNPVPQVKLRLVNPVPQQSGKTKRASGSTLKKQSSVHPVPHKPKSPNSNRLHPPTIPGHKWKPSGLTGWELYTRTASTSANGKRSSTGKYLAYYSQKAVEKMHERKTKAVA